MPNIPPIRHSTVQNSHPVNRGAKTAASENITEDPHPVKRHLERRNRRERRRRQVYIRFDRRKRGLHRRKYETAPDKTENSTALSDTVGKNINTTA